MFTNCVVYLIQFFFFQYVSLYLKFISLGSTEFILAFFKKNPIWQSLLFDWNIGSFAFAVVIEMVLF